MWTKYHKKRRLGRFVLPAITIAFVSYFGYHCIHGDYGLKATEVFEQRRIERGKELADLVARREHLEKAVALLSDGSLDKDMLDQYARYQLTYSKDNEVVIFNK
ncbi:septum formation initiator family protein [Rhizobium sp. BK602]|uniref:FtsB family cell division protein n=1 Tax=Rhizobium sp. BK602 TaxID=2586986 RepID=UPI001610F1BD|nr:septum formation initiator family protein [Rhizobium sp. BK602]MBB3607980.1 cell division protein FtsB [Rhizobium sp. BK602]